MKHIHRQKGRGEQKKKKGIGDHPNWRKTPRGEQAKEKKGTQEGKGRSKREKMKLRGAQKTDEKLQLRKERKSKSKEARKGISIGNT